jgi:hypothetical protein
MAEMAVGNRPEFRRGQVDAGHSHRTGNEEAASVDDGRAHGAAARKCGVAVHRRQP